MKSENYLPHIREHYEDLPYPPYEPAEEYNQLQALWMHQLPRINHYCFAGHKRFEEEPFRVLSAGGGTGHAAIFLAEQLRDMPAEIVYVDMSEASMAIAKKRAEIRQLENITFHHGSLLDLPSMGLEPFDYIDCSGVLHHLADPDAGLQALTDVLVEDGAMSLMVYGAVGRTAVYQMQDLMKLVNEGVTKKDEKLARLKKINQFLPRANWLNLARTVYRTPDDFGAHGDAGIYDLYLHEQDRAYTVPQLFAWLRGAKLQVVGIPGDGGKQMMYLPQSYIRDMPLLEKISQLPEEKRYAIGELMGGMITKHTFYAAKQPKKPADLADEELVPTFNPSAMSKEQQRAMVAQLAAGQAVPVPRQGLNTTLQPDAVMKALMQHVDSKTPLKHLINKTMMQLQKENHKVTRDELKARVSSILQQFVILEFIYLRAADVPIYLGADDLQARFLAGVDKKA